MNRFIKGLSAWFIAIALILSLFPMAGVYAQDLSADIVGYSCNFEKSSEGYGNTGAYDNKDIYENKTGSLDAYENEDTVTPVISTPEDYYRFAKDSELFATVGNLAKAAEVKSEAETKTLPDFVDNSTSPYFPPINNQEGLGACVSFAVTHYQFTYTMNKALGIPTTADNTFSVKWIYNLANYGSDMGSTAFTIYKILKEHGCALNKTLPYDTVDFKSWSTDEAVWREAMNYRLSDSQQLADIGAKSCEIISNKDSDLDTIKTCLTNGDILKFSSYIYSWEYSNIKTHADAPENSKFANQQYVRQVSGQEGGHGMVIVGYNDNLWCDINNNNLIDYGEMGALKIANSWGEAYGNKGFMWIAYDALNEVSAVSGVEHAEQRQAGIEDIYRIEVATPKDKDIYLKFTLNTAYRSQFKVSFSADKNGTEYNSIFLDGAGYESSFNNCAFDGTNTPCDATFLYPLNDLAPDLTAENFEQYNFRITVKDTDENSVPLIVKNISLVNEYTNTEYKVSADYPISLDGAEFTANVKDCTKSNAVIYYIGYDNPHLHYKTTNGQFKSVAMEKNTEQLGAEYKYVIYDVTEDISLYFTDSEGNTDNNSGEFYKASEGLNFYYTQGVREPLTIHDFGFSNGTPDVAKRCLIAPVVTGGYQEYRYSFIIENLAKGEVKEYGYDYNFERSPYSFPNEGTYRITVKVRDHAKEVVTLTKDIEVLNHPFQFEALTMSGATLVSKNIEFKSITAFETIATFGGYRPKARFVITDNTGKVWLDEVIACTEYDTIVKSSTTLCNFTPTRAGEYTLTVSSDDSSENHAEKSLTFTVYHMIYGDADGNGVVNIKDATAIRRQLVGLYTEGNYYRELSDCDNNAVVNIQDATAIQCFAANLTTRSKNAGKVMEYTLPTKPTTEPATKSTEAPTEAPTTPIVSNQVTFTNSLRWSGTIYCYYWSEDNKSMTTWPGETMVNAGTNEFFETMYTFDVPKGATCVIFTNGNEQTVDISFKADDRYYAQNKKVGNGYDVGMW